MGNIQSESITSESDNTINDLKTRICSQDQYITELKQEVSQYKKNLKHINELLQSKTNQLNKLKRFIKISDTNNEQIIEHYLSTNKNNMFLIPDHIEHKVLLRFMTFYNELLRTKYINHGLPL